MSANENNERVTELARPANLARALAEAFDGVQRRLAFVAFRCGRDHASAFVADDGRDGSDAPDERMPVGCLAKLLTATLATATFATRGISVDTPLAELLSVGLRALFEGVTLRHLLEHTHGIDDSLIEQPVLNDGFVNVGELAHRASVERRLSRPGDVYSYGNVGAWLTAAVLERLTARPYAALLRDDLLAPLGIRIDGAAGANGSFLCPSTGVGLSLSIRDWLRFLAYAASDGVWLPEPGGVRSKITALPGWHPLEHGVRLGWKWYGHGWFGHQSAWPGSSALLRISPEREIALALISRDHAATVIAARVFGTALPELFDLRMPAPLASAGRPDLQRYVGRFSSAALCVEVRLRGGALELHLQDRARGRRQCAALSPAAEQTFFATPPKIESFAYVQFVVVRGLTYLWNGRLALPRR
jgi:CubicO group peptidase (beta-lactamase class C family)